MQQYLPSTTRERILDLMKEQHMTQKDLAERIGCARSTLGRFLNGETVKALKTEAGSDLEQSKEKAETATKAILNKLDKNRDMPMKKIEPGQLADAVAQSVEHLPGVDAGQVKSLFLSLMGDQNGNGSSV